MSLTAALRSQLIAAVPGKVTNRVTGGLPLPSAPSFDVVSTTAAQLTRLKTTQPMLARTIAEAQKTYAAQLAAKPPARILVTTSAANGDMPVLIVVPPGYQASKPTTVQTHYHGDRTSAAAASGSHTLRIFEKLKSDPQTIFVIPEARGNVGTNGTDWANVSNQKATTEEALKAAGVSNITRKIVSVHSAGGRALAKALATPNGVEADQLRLLDCLFENPAGPGAYSNIVKLLPTAKGVKDIVVIASGAYPASRDKGVIAASGGRAHLEKLQRKAGFSDHEAAVRNQL